MKKLFVLFISLLIMVNGAVFAQETDDEKDGSQDVVTGSVSSNAYYSIPVEVFDGIQPMQVNNGVQVEARLDWQYAIVCLWFNCSIDGRAITRINVWYHAPTPEMCAQVESLIKNGINYGGTDYYCAPYNSSRYSISTTKSVSGNPRNAYWVVNTYHTVAYPGVFWAPRLQSSVSL